MASATIGAMSVKLGLNSAEYDAGLKRSQQNLTGFQKGVRSALGELEAGFQSTANRAGSFGSVLSSMGLAGVAAGAVLGGVAIAVGQATKAFAKLDEIGDTAAKIGVTTDYLQEMRFAVHRLGGDAADADTALAGFAEALGAAKLGLSAKAIKPFQALGLDPKDFKTTGDALDAVVAKIANLQDSSLQAATASKFGLTSMLPAIRAGEGAFNDARSAAHEFGGVIDADVIAKGGAANDKLEEIRSKIDNELTTAFANLADPILGAANALAEVTSGVNDLIVKLGAFEAWVKQHNILAIFDAVNNAGAGVGSFTHLDRWGKSLQPRPKAPTPQFDLSGQFGRSDLLSGFDTGSKTTVRNLAAEAAAAAAAAAAARGHAKAESERAKAIKAAAAAARDSVNAFVDQVAASRGVIEALERERDQRELSKRELILQQGAIDAAKAPTEALATTILGLAAAEARAADEAERYAAIGKGLKVPDALPQTLETVQGLTPALMKMESAFDSGVDVVLNFSNTVDDLRYSFEGALDALKNGDWSGAAGGIIRAIKAIQAAQAAGAGTKLGSTGSALATGAVAAGGMIGGVGGGILSGAGMGAQIGSLIPGVGTLVGAGVGAVVGLIGGLFSGSKAKAQQKAAEAKAKADEAARVAAEAAAKALEIANQKRSLEIQIMELSGNAAGALAATRQDELAAMDESNRALAQQAYDLIDLNTATAKLQELTNQHRQLEIDLMEAQGNAAGALAAQRQLELAALDPSLRALKQQVFDAEDAAAAQSALAEATRDATQAAKDLQAQRVQDAQDKVNTARDALSAALERESAALEGTRDKFQGFADGIDGVLKSLDGGGGNSLQAMAAEFARVGARAKLGDAQALGDIQGLAQPLADKIRSSAGSSVEAAQGLAGIRSTLMAARDTASRTASNADLQLAALRAQVQPLLNIDTTTRSIDLLMADLSLAQAGLVELTTEQNAGIAAVGEKLDAISTQLAAQHAETLQLQLSVEATNYKMASILDGATRPEGLQLNTVPAT